MARQLQAGLRRRRAIKRVSFVLELRMRPVGGDRVQVLQRRMTMPKVTAAACGSPTYGTVSRTRVRREWLPPRSVARISTR